MPLTMVNSGEEFKVMNINGPHGGRMRLTNLGINPGSTIRVINRNSSSLLVGIRDSRIMINVGLAHQIQVQ